METTTGPNISLAELVHPRLEECCSALYQGGHFPQAAFEAMKQVELALREVSLAPTRLPARKLIQRVFGGFRGLKLAVPAGPAYQSHAQRLFDGAFGYYRNYGAHDGKNIDRKICTRVLVLASELLDLLAASERSLPGVGGVEGLVEAGFFGSSDEFLQCLEFYEMGHDCSGEVFDGYWEQLAEAGITETQESLLWDLGLVESHSYPISEDEHRGRWDFWDVREIIELSTLGSSLLEECRTAAKTAKTTTS